MKKRILMLILSSISNAYTSDTGHNFGLDVPDAEANARIEAEKIVAEIFERKEAVESAAVEADEKRAAIEADKMARIWASARTTDEKSAALEKTFARAKQARIEAEAEVEVARRERAKREVEAELVRKAAETGGAEAEAEVKAVFATFANARKKALEEVEIMATEAQVGSLFKARMELYVAEIVDDVEKAWLRLLIS